jgi:CheY-like chemotaxis protein
LLDVKMPDVGGPDLQDRLSNLGSNLPIVFITGHADIPTTVRTTATLNEASRLAVDIPETRFPATMRGAERIGKAGASFRSLGDPLWDTSSSQGRLLSTLLAAKFGRKPKLSEYQRLEALKRRAAGETLAEIAKSYAVDISMISRL